MEGEDLRTVRTVADRINVDVDGLRDRIERAYAANPLWAKLSMAQKLRQLVEEALEAAEKRGQRD